MKIPTKTHAIICTRSKDRTERFKRLLEYLKDADVNVEVVSGAKSMFQGYTYGVERANPNANDVVIFCHDDIEIMSSKAIFYDAIRTAMDPKIGFVGVAGCPELPQSGFWRDGGVSGVYFLGESYNACKMMAGGGIGTSVLLDGIFLACQWKKLKKVGTQCPDYLHDGWHFSDIHLTYEAHKLGYENTTFPLFVLHTLGHKEDGGFDDAWMAARIAFCDHNGLTGLRPGQAA